MIWLSAYWLMPTSTAQGWVLVAPGSSAARRGKATAGRKASIPIQPGIRTLVMNADPFKDYPETPSEAVALRVRPNTSASSRKAPEKVTQKVFSTGSIPSRNGAGFFFHCDSVSGPVNPFYFRSEEHT